MNRNLVADVMLVAGGLMIAIAIISMIVKGGL